MYGCAATSICNTIDRKKANDRECLPLLLLMIIVEVFLCVVVVCCLLLGCCGHEFWVLQFWYIGYLVHSLGIDDSTTGSSCCVCGGYFFFMSQIGGLRDQILTTLLQYWYWILRTYPDFCRWWGWIGRAAEGWLPLHRQASSWCCVMSWLCI